MRPWDFIKGVARLSTLPEQVNRVEEKVIDLSNQMGTCVTHDQLEHEMRMHKESTTEKLDLVIELLKKNGT